MIHMIILLGAIICELNASFRIAGVWILPPRVSFPSYRRATVALQGTAPELEQPEKKASGGQGSEKKRDRLVVRFDDRWVDLTAWRNVHPAGEPPKPLRRCWRQFAPLTPSPPSCLPAPLSPCRM